MLTRAHVDPDLGVPSADERFMLKLLSLGMFRLSLDAECEVFFWLKQNTERNV